MKSVLIIINFFGEWPCWFSIFLLSCGSNPTITWHFHTDCGTPSTFPPNVKFFHISLEDYYEQVSRTLGINFRPEHTYKICDVRPAYGVLYADEIAGYDYFGYGDLDVIYGDLRKFLTEEVLASSFISMHGYIASGHFTLFKNDTFCRNAFQLIPNWKRYLEDPRLLPWKQRLNEYGLTKVFRVRNILPAALARLPVLRKLNLVLAQLFYPNQTGYSRAAYFKEHYTTPFSPMPWMGNKAHPAIWYWKSGKITNRDDIGYEFPYLHLMNFKHPRFLDAKYGGKHAWAEKDSPINFDPETYTGQDLVISPGGISLLQNDDDTF